MAQRLSKATQDILMLKQVRDKKRKKKKYIHNINRAWGIGKKVEERGKKERSKERSTDRNGEEKGER